MPHCLLSGRGRTPWRRDQSRHDPEVPVKMCQDCALVANLSFGHAETVVQLGIPPLSTLYGLLARDRQRLARNLSRAEIGLIHHNGYPLTTDTTP